MTLRFLSSTESLHEQLITDNFTESIAPLFKERIGSGNMRDGFFCYLSCNGCSVLTFVG